MKKFLCLLLVMVTCFTATSFAATDLKDIKDTKYEAAVDKLVLFKIVNGYGDGTFLPANKVTRAELSKMLVIAMGKESQVEAAKKKYLDFSDVLSSYWAYGHIAVAASEKLVNGYEDGTFKPAGNVTYAEAAAMVLRALGFEEEVKRSELTWPNNYMSCADDLDLFEGISNIKAGDPANRGDIAILIWNALRTGTAEIVAYNDKGVIYGEGTPMITEYLGYTYIEEADVTNIKFSDNLKEATVTFKEEGKKEKKVTLDAIDALDMFGRKVSLLYDPMDGKILELTTDKEYTMIDAEVTNISETKIYIANRRNGYKLPEEKNILMYGISSYSEAAEAILIMKDATLEYLVLMGPSDIKVGVVVDNDYLINDDYGIRVRDVGETKGGDGYFVANDDQWPSQDSVILYYLDADDFLVVLKKLDLSKAKAISSIGSKSIKTEDKNEYKFESDDDYTVINVDGTKLESLKLSQVDTKTDKLIAVNYNAHYYFFIIEDAISDNLDPEIEDALYDLEDWVDEALEYDEELYTQESYHDLTEALDYANATDHTSTLTRIQKACTKIEEAIEGLEKATGTTEKKTVKAKKALRKLVNGEAKDVYDNSDLYTWQTYDVFDVAYDNAKDLLDIDDATLTEIDDAERDLYEAIDALAKKK